MEKRTDSIYICLPSERYTPFSLAKKIGAKAVLESASFNKGRERISILMTAEAFKIVQDDEGIAFLIDGRRLPFNASGIVSRNAVGHEKEPDILDALVYVASQNKNPIPEIPLPASGIGYLGYEFVRKCDTVRLENQFDELRIPECCFVAGHIYIVFDHFTEKLHIFALNYAERQIDLKKEVDALVKRLNDMDFSYMDSAEDPAPCTLITDIEQSKKEYCEKVVTLKKHIVAGDIIQAVPSRRVRLECETSALEIYRRLRAINPSPYLLYLDFGEFQLAGCSPESLVRVIGGRASIHPIAGSIRRGKSASEDEMLKLKLSNDPKERAEHLMLVDLARNDLGRVCKAGSVKATQFMEVETFSHIMHIVSNVEGDVEEGIPPVQVLRAAFPAGTVSGAPKISAMQILSRIEKVRRGFYAGAVGYVRPDGDLDFCITLRCALKQGKVWTLQAGGGIVYDSNPEREFEETNEKMGALIAAFKVDGQLK